MTPKIKKDYSRFIASKRHTANQYGFKAQWIPSYLKDFQAYIVDKALYMGRAAIFADTGLGKTAIQLTIAQNIVQQTNKPVLILTPLAVAFQFLQESELLGIDDISYSKDGKYKTKIVITNYERLQKFNASEFTAILLDESSILKNFDGVIKTNITLCMKKVPYRMLSTATPSPNDYIELGTSSEALGGMGYVDMLSRFFSNKEGNVVKTQNIGTEWILKPHAEEDFFQWVATWSIPIRKPSDIGFSDEGYDLPELQIRHNPIQNNNQMVIDGQVQMFNRAAYTMKEITAEQKATITERCEKACELASYHPISVYWCNRNDESQKLSTIDRDAYELLGSMDLDKKEDILLSFSRGDITKLITKPQITAFGLNWQHCNHTTLFPTFSYEQYYQSMRRFWRFGQSQKVIVDLVYSYGQERVLQSLQAKSDKAVLLFEKLNQHINTKVPVITESNKASNKINIPKWIK